jgi:CheY-like chemotaxis protein
MVSRPVLIADPRAASRAVHRLILELAGYTVIEAVTGSQAINFARWKRPAAILMEVSLPGIDGLESTRRLKSDAATAEIPIVVLTQSSDPADREEAEQSGCDGYLVMPCLPQTLLAELHYHGHHGGTPQGVVPRADPAGAT